MKSGIIYGENAGRSSVHLRLTPENQKKFDALIKKFDMSRDAFVTGIVNKALNVNVDKIQLHLVEVIKEVTKARMKKDNTKSFYDQFMFKNASRTIFDLCAWQMFSNKAISKKQLEDNVNSVLEIFKYFPEKLQESMKDEKIEFEKMKNPEYVAKKINNIKAITFMSGKKYQGKKAMV